MINLLIFNIQYSIINIYGDVTGFDSYKEIFIASSGWLLWPLKIKQIKYKG